MVLKCRIMLSLQIGKIGCVYVASWLYIVDTHAVIEGKVLTIAEIA